MSASRRSFLLAAGALSAAGLSGCEVPLPVWLAEKPDHGPAEAPEGTEVDEVSHVLQRLSYGARPSDYGRVRAMGIETYIEKQLAPEAINDDYCERHVRRLVTLDLLPGELFEYKERFLLDELTRGTLLRAVHSERQLYEVMVDFWSDHFNIDSSKGDCAWLKTADDREVIRKHALGSFPNMLRASALSPAMLWYLDGRANAVSEPGEKPNENYARELLELHAMGVHGGYSQEDVMELARCLTGWTVKHNTWFTQGTVHFRPGAHDTGEKRVLGTRIAANGGAEEVDLVVNLVARQPATAQYIASKLCRRFIGEAAPESAVAAVAKTFQDTGGEIAPTLRTLFGRAEFRGARGTKFKRPFHFAVSALRASDAMAKETGVVSTYLERMGHAPFQYPTPDGYPDETEPWLGTLLWRWHFALALAENRLDGIRVDWTGLRERLGGQEATLRHFLARTPNAAETELMDASARGAALLLASPAFQRY